VLFGAFGEVGESISSVIGDEKGIRGIEDGTRCTWGKTPSRAVLDVAIVVLVVVSLQSLRLVRLC